MELPFKYIVLCIIRELNDRNMDLIINKNNLVKYFSELISKAYFSIDEKIEIGNNFNFEYELSDLLTKYYHYFDIDDEKIIFDSEYIDELGALILEEMDNYDEEYICEIDFVIDDNRIRFLEIIGVKIRKELYNYLLDIEREIENCYEELYRFYCYKEVNDINTNNMINKMKKLYLKKNIMLFNTKNLLSNIEYNDLVKYASDEMDRITELDDISLLHEDDSFDASDIMYDSFLRNIFTNNNSYVYSLWESLIINSYSLSENIRLSTIKFYLTFIEFLNKEIEQSDEILNLELTQVKYRIMNGMDSVYGTNLFMNSNYVIEDKIFDEKYDFIEEAVYYFINELLMYDDEKYMNIKCAMGNIMVYLNNILKKILIQTYYELTDDKNIISEIKNNKLYGVNTISSNLLKDILDNPKTKIKDK